MSNHLSIRLLLRRTTPVAMMILAFTAVLAVWTPGPTSAQAPASCNQVLSRALKNLAKGCNVIDRNQVCYGNPQLKAEYRDAANPPTFAKAGDIAALDAFKSISTGPLSLTSSEWGLAAIKLAVNNLPGTTAGQVVTFILYGDASVTDTSQSGSLAARSTTPSAPKCSATTTRATYLRGAPGPNEQQIKLLQPNTVVNVAARVSSGAWLYGESQGQSGWVFAQVAKLDCDINSLPVDDASTPKTTAGLQAFYFSTGVGAQSECKDVAPNGLLVQSPSGQKVAFRANGADITMGSTLVLRAEAGQFMTVSTLAGSATITSQGKAQQLVAGQELSLPLGGTNGLDVIGPPGPPRNLQNQFLLTSTLCDVAGALNLTVPCVVGPPAPRVPPPPPPQQVPPQAFPPQVPPQPFPPSFPVVPPPSIPTLVFPPSFPGMGDTCDQRTFNFDGTVCIPGYGRQPCNRDGICNNGEHSYICPEDCGAPPSPATTCPSSAPC